MKFILLFCLTFPLLLVAQINFVPNQSFENYKNCQNLNPDESINELIDWFNPSNGSPDYYNSCSSDPQSSLSVPTHNSYYTKYPLTGNAYIGLFIYYTIKTDRTLREYASIKFKKPFNKSSIYFIEFYASPKDSITDITVPCFIDRLGASVSKTNPFEVNLPNQPMKRQKYIGNQDKILDRIDQWTRISGCIIGDEEQYLTIGNFYNDEETNVGKDCEKYFPNSAYYYVDDVGVYEFNPLPDTILLCDDESITIGHKFLDGTYQWNTGSQDSTIVVSESGTYIVNVDMGSCILSDTVVAINMNDLDAYLPVDTTICNGKKYVIDIPIRGKYLWNTGSSNNSIEISKEGLYSVQIENQCGVLNYSFDVMTQECDCQIHTANIFSPNHDAINDEMIFYMDCQYQFNINSIRIYDRWGSLVFEQIKGMDDKIMWNGKLNGNRLSTGLYCWVINYSYIDDGQQKSIIKSGNVTIIY